MNTAMDERELKSLRVSLSRIDGQLGGIRRMIEDCRPCVEILQQTRAAEAAIKKVSVTVFRAYVQTHVIGETGRGASESEEALNGLRKILAGRFRVI